MSYKYKIKCEDDLLTGATLTVTIPESDLDKKALYTILFDTPSFILPFNCVYVDGEIRFVYRIGHYSKLQHLAGSWARNDYIELWAGLVSPLLECEDWFMQSSSFLIQTEYLFYNEETKSVCYIYIPSVNYISDHSSMKELVVDVSKLISVDDAYLENKLLKAIIKSYDSEDILKMLRAHTSEVDVLSDMSFSAGSYAANSPPGENGMPDKPIAAYHTDSSVAAPKSGYAQENKPVYDAGNQEYSDLDFGDVIIDIPEKGAKTKKDRKKQKDNEGKSSGGIFGGIFRKKSEKAKNVS